jgi:hypothetical protein
MSKSSIDTTPNSPLPLESQIDAAARCLPDALLKMPKEKGFGATDPGNGHWVVVAATLVKQLADEGHSTAAAEWAVNQMIQRDLLVPEIAAKLERRIIGYRRDETRAVVKADRYFGSHADDPRYQIPVFGAELRKPLAPPDRPVPYNFLLVTSTLALWAWWRNQASAPDGTCSEERREAGGHGAASDQRGGEQGGRMKGKRRRGRKQGSKTSDTDTRLYHDWKAAYQATGITKAEFLRERGLPQTALAAIERGRANVKRQNNPGRKKTGKASQDPSN